MRLLLAILITALAAAQPQQPNEPNAAAQAASSASIRVHLRPNSSPSPPVLLAQAAPQQNEPKPARLTGTVTSPTGDPIPNTVIRLQLISQGPGGTGKSLIATTNDNGSFTLDPVEPASYLLGAQHPGYLTARYGARSPLAPGQNLTIRAGQTLQDLHIELTPQAVITGRITDQNGDPLQKASVYALRRGWSQGVRALTLTAPAATTNDLGEYRIPNLLPGPYYLAATDRTAVPLGFQQDAPKEANIITYFPNATSSDGVAPLNVSPGAELQAIDIRLRRTRVFSVTGKAVEAATGAPAGNVFVAAISPDEASLPPTFPRNRAQTQPADGSFALRNLTPGHYVLQTQRVSLNGNPTSKLTGRMEITIDDADITDLVFPVGPGATITGTVRVEKGEWKQFASSTPPPAVLVEPVQSGRVALAPISDQGSFTLEDVEPSVFSVGLRNFPAGVYLKSARFDGQDVTRSTIDLTSATGGVLDVVLATDAATMTGTVHNDDGDPMAGVMVALWSEAPDARSDHGVHITVTDQSGAFRIPASLAPGKYRVAAFEQAENGLLQNRDFLARFPSATKSLELAPGAQQNEDVKLIPLEEIEREEAKLP